MIDVLKHAALALLGLDRRPRLDRDRQRIMALTRPQLHDVLHRSGQTPIGASWATTEALRRVTLRHYDAKRITPQHIQETQ